MEYSARRCFRSNLLQPFFLACCLFSGGLLLAQNLTVIGGTTIQQRLTACIEQVSAKDLDKLPGLDHSMTVVILGRERFLQVKGSFRAYRTKLAFSNLATRRIYLSSDVFANLDTAMRCIPHEIGHFVTRSTYEDHAEIAAGAIRKKAREVCTMPSVSAQPRALSSQVKSSPPDGTE